MLKSLMVESARPSFTRCWRNGAKNITASFVTLCGINRLKTYMNEGLQLLKLV
jgi:hypothetical protein